MIVNEILQWLAIIWAGWAIHCVAKAINMIGVVVKTMLQEQSKEE